MEAARDGSYRAPTHSTRGHLRLRRGRPKWLLRSCRAMLILIVWPAPGSLGAGQISLISVPGMARPVKPWLSIAEQIALLRRRGMEIPDDDLAKQWLSAVGYYRLSGYWYPFRGFDHTGAQRRTSTFLPGTTFDEVAGLYEFDRRLKALTNDALGKVEVAFRSQIGHRLGEISPLAHTNPRHFRPTFPHQQWWNTAQRRIDRARGRDEFVDHHDIVYGGNLPIWVLTDVLDFADLSKLYAGLTAHDQGAIAEQFAVTMPPDASKSQRQRWARKPPLANWLEHLSVVRNICAHHGRLWNRQLTPIGTSTRIRHLPVFTSLPADQTQIERVYGTICVLSYLLDAVTPGHSWRSEVDELVTESFTHFTHHTPVEMGFPET